MTAPAVPSRNWLFGAAPDLLLGCGLAWLIVFVLRIFLGDAVAETIPGVLLVMCITVPHYGATLALVYDKPESRRKYAFISVYASLFLLLALAVSVRSSLVGSLILTIYLTWSPWHYTGQNYGIFLTLLGRRAGRPDEILKRFVYGSFVFSYALTFFSVHGSVQATYAPVSYQGTLFRLMPIGIPETVSTVAIGVAMVGYTVCTLMAIVGMLRLGSLSQIAPCLALMFTQALWFTVPAFIRQWRLYTGDLSPFELYSAYGFLWIAAAHSAQYLWFCTYYAVGSGAPRKALGYLGKSVFGGYAVWTLPGVFFAPALLGAFPAESGLTLMVAAIVNLHHFILDGAIWKLRDSSLAKILLRGEKTGARRIRTSTRTYVWGIGVAGGLAFAVVAVNLYEAVAFGEAIEVEDVDRAALAMRHLTWIGNDSPGRRVQLGRTYARQGDLAEGLRQFQASLELQPTAPAWRSIAQIHEQNGRFREAQLAYNEALVIEPGHVPSLLGAGTLWLRERRPDRALPLLEKAARLEPDNPDVEQPLAIARRTAPAERAP